MSRPARTGRARGRPALRSLKLTLTEVCNLACPYCYQRARQPRSMSLETVWAALLLARDLGGRDVSVVLSGGEPLLVPDLVALVLDAVAAGRTEQPRLRVRLITNGTLLQPPLLARLVESQVDLQLSCDGVAAAQDRRAPETWSRLDSLLESIRWRYPRYWRRHLAVAMTVTPDNVAYLARSVAWALERGVQRLEIGLACGLPRDGGAWDGTVLAEQMAEVYALSLQHLRRTERIPVTYLRSNPIAATTVTDACGAADVTTLAVAADGSVDGCGLLADVARWHRSDTVRRAAAKLRLGHVADPDFRSRWSALAARPPEVLFPSAGRAAPAGPCRDCAQRVGCTICPVAGADPRRVPDAHCTFERLVQEQRRALSQDSPLTAWLAAAGVPDSQRSALVPLIQEARQRQI